MLTFKAQSVPVFVLLTYVCSVFPSSYMYWTDWGEEPRIERAGMDGSNRYSNYRTLKQTCLFAVIFVSFGIPVHLDRGLFSSSSVASCGFGKK